MKRIILALLLCAALLSAFCFAAHAADPEYSGPLDPETGEPLNGERGQADENRVRLSGNMYYDWLYRDFVYPVSDTLSEVHADAADGMVLTTPVSLRITGEAALSVYKDGIEYTGNTERISETGAYTVFAVQGGQSRRMLGFTLVGSSTNALHTFVVPDGFYIREATRDESYIYADRYSVSMETEGAYAIEYECSATDIIYKLETRIDRTPTLLEFSGKIDNQGRVRSALRFSGLEEGGTAILTRFGENVPVTVDQDGSGTIPDPGTYRLTVRDAAGNETEYDFVILQYFNLQSWVFFLMVFAAIAAVVVYVWMKRRRLKVA